MKAKTIAIVSAALAYAVIGFFVAEYLAGIAYFLLNKSVPDNITLDTWAAYWHWYGDDPVQRKRLQLSACAAAILVYLGPLIVAAALSRKQRSLHGDARFARSSEVRKAGLYAERGIIVGKYQGRYLMFDGQQFVLLAAPTRSGKGVAIVLPNLLNFAGSVVVLDIKLENFKLTSGFRAAHGQKVFLFNPFAEDCRTHRWNPLDGISRDRNFRVGDVLAIGQVLYPSDADEKSKFWNDSARNIFLAFVLYLLETPDLPCTFGEVLRQGSGKGKPIKEYIQDIISARVNGDEALSDECLDAFGRFLSAPDDTLGSIISTFNAPLLIFANPIVDAATSASDIDVTAVRKELMSIYIGIQPNRLADAALLINLFFSQLINLNTKELPQDNPTLKHQCLLILDEFTAIGKVGIIAKAVSYIAGYNLRLLPIIQSISQLESVYGEKDTRTFVTNHALQILYPPREQKDANDYSEMLGYFTEKSVSTGISRPRAWGGNSGSSSENISDQRRALMLPQELKELGLDKEIILLENTKPILCQKARYFDDHSFIDRLKGVSPTLRALGKELPTKDQLEKAAFVLNELAAPVPQMDIERHKAKAEKRMREAKPNEVIDPSKLAIDVDALPTIDNPDAPSEEQIADLVDAFFSQLEWVDQKTGEAAEAPTAGVIDFGADASADTGDGVGDDAGGGEIEPVFETVAAQEEEPPDDDFEEPAIAEPPISPTLRRPGAPEADAIRLTALDN